jgi:hypothetical protein
MAHERPDPLRVLAARYRASQAGRTGSGARDFTLDYKELQLGDAATQIDAEELLRRAAAHSGGLLELETHPRDPRLILLVRLARDGGEAWLFAQIGEASPSEERRLLSALFQKHQQARVPEICQESWSDWCHDKAQAALDGEAIQPFSRTDLEANDELLRIISQVLDWKGESMIRFASCVICRDSKRLEQLQPKIETALSEITHGVLKTLEDLGLLEKPRQVLFHGPLQLDSLAFGSLRGAVSISEPDIRAAHAVTCSAERILTVENLESFLELVKLNRGDTLLIQTSYPSRAVLCLLARLPAKLPSFHFGDTDVWGFDILCNLREKTGCAFRPLHMHFRPRVDAPSLTSPELKILTRLLKLPSMSDCHEALVAMQKSGTKGDFEQESLGRPTLDGWPFYEHQS